MKPIVHFKPWITDSDRVAVKEVLRSGMLFQGEKTRSFERALSEWFSAEGGVAVGSGTAALVLDLTALRVGKGDEVILPTYVCVSVLEAVLAVGPTPVFCDVGPQWVVTHRNMSSCISDWTRALIVSHMYGVFADIKSFN
jgi:UDP-4-amino-4-deoxy-L-arabinose-oxoglutarate aminotransferase